MGGNCRYSPPQLRPWNSGPGMGDAIPDALSWPLDDPARSFGRRFVEPVGPSSSPEWNATVRHLVTAGTLVAVMLGTAGSARGQNPATQPKSLPRGFATITGVVIDSVRGRPLSGAVVMVDGSLRQGISDSSGHFRIDSVEPGRRQLGVFHPLLDSLSIGITTNPLSLEADSAILWCWARPPPKRSSENFVATGERTNRG
jgi:hypothetical protein